MDSCDVCVSCDTLLSVDCIPFRLGTVLAPTIATALRKSAFGTPHLSTPQQQLITDFSKVAT